MKCTEAAGRVKLAKQIKCSGCGDFERSDRLARYLVLAIVRSIVDALMRAIAVTHLFLICADLYVRLVCIGAVAAHDRLDLFRMSQA